jgi:hypothetical protein
MNTILLFLGALIPAVVFMKIWNVNQINLAGIKRIMELESAVASMALEVAKLRTEVDALIEANPPKSLVRKGKQTIVVYKEEG